jgi:hypothetical protein
MTLTGHLYGLQGTKVGDLGAERPHLPGPDFATDPGKQCSIDRMPIIFQSLNREFGVNVPLVLMVGGDREKNRGNA